MTAAVDLSKIAGLYEQRWVTVHGHPMADGRGRVLAHRLIAADKIGRPLRDDEAVHHINGDHADNRPENLQVMPHSEHARLHDDNIRKALCARWACTIKQVGHFEVDPIPNGVVAFTHAEAARYLGVTGSYVRTLAEKGILRDTALVAGSGNCFVSAESVEEYRVQFGSAEDREAKS